MHPCLPGPTLKVAACRRHGTVAAAFARQETCRREYEAQGQMGVLDPETDAGRERPGVIF